MLDGERIKRDAFCKYRFAGCSKFVLRVRATALADVHDVLCEARTVDLMRTRPRNAEVVVGLTTALRLLHKRHMVCSFVQAMDLRLRRALGMLRLGKATEAAEAAAEAGKEAGQSPLAALSVAARLAAAGAKSFCEGEAEDEALEELAVLKVSAGLRFVDCMTFCPSVSL